MLVLVDLLVLLKSLAIFLAQEAHRQIFAYEGAQLDFAKLTLTHVLLNLPMRFLCKEDCKTSSLLAAKLLTELFFVVGLFSQQLLQCRKRTLYIRIVPAFGCQ